MIFFLCCRHTGSEWLKLKKFLHDCLMSSEVYPNLSWSHDSFHTKWNLYFLCFIGWNWGLIINVPLVLLFSLSYIICEFDRFFHKGWTKYSFSFQNIIIPPNSETKDGWWKKDLFPRLQNDIDCCHQPPH